MFFALSSPVFGALFLHNIYIGKVVLFTDTPDNNLKRNEKIVRRKTCEKNERRFCRYFKKSAD